MDLTAVDSRFLYNNMKTIELKNKIKNMEGKTTFKNKLNKEIEKQKLKEVSEQMEALFVDMMFKEMRKNINKFRLIPKNPAEDIFEDMKYKEYALKIAKSNQLGLAKNIYNQLSKYI